MDRPAFRWADSYSVIWNPVVALVQERSYNALVYVTQNSLFSEIKAMKLYKSKNSKMPRRKILQIGSGFLRKSRRKLFSSPVTCMAGRGLLTTFQRSLTPTTRDILRRALQLSASHFFLLRPNPRRSLFKQDRSIFAHFGRSILLSKITLWRLRTPLYSASCSFRFTRS